MKNWTTSSAALALLALQGNAAETASPTYLPMNVLNFIIDGPKLAARHVYVDVYGAYVRDGNIDSLYQDKVAVARSRSWPSPLPHVVVMTDNSSRTLRAKLVECQADPLNSQLGCDIAIRGRATECEVTSVVGVSHKEPCLEAFDLTPPSSQFANPD